MPPDCWISAAERAHLSVGKGARLALELDFEGLDVVLVHVGVAHLQYELVRFRVCNEGDHVREERVRRNVEWHAEAQVAGPLVHQAGQLGPRALGAALLRSVTKNWQNM